MSIKKISEPLVNPDEGKIFTNPIDGTDSGHVYTEAELEQVKEIEKPVKQLKVDDPDLVKSKRKKKNGEEDEEDAPDSMLPGVEYLHDPE